MRSWRDYVNGGGIMTSRIMHGDCREHMAAMEPNGVDAIVTDPPYGLSFMGKGWDKGVPGVEFWQAAYRVMKPGAYLLSFGGTRTFHRVAVAIEDAGFEIHDTISWLYGSGFPKHTSKLKPAWEPVIVARKSAPKATPLNIDACRIGTGDDRSSGGASGMRANGQSYGGYPRFAANGFERQSGGRWPANVVLDDEAAAMLDAQSGVSTSQGGKHSGSKGTRENVGGYGFERAEINRPTDTGGASRFFYTAKASRSERNAGLEGMPERIYGLHDDDGHRQPGERKNNHTAPMPAANHHPTVKPIALMRWLVRLVTPTGGTVLDPFAGSGTTGCAAVLEGFAFIGIEQDAEYVAIAERRIAHWGGAPRQPELMEAAS